MQHDTVTQQESIGPWQAFAYPFRIFFLSLALLAVIAVPIWLAVITGHLQPPLALPALYWHQHELLFAFLYAGIAGFLLTAVCVWTGTERLHGGWLLGLWLVWLAGRLLMAAGEPIPAWLVLGVNLAFLPLVMLDAGWRIWRSRQLRQLVILLVLAVLWLLQLGFLLQPAGPYAATALVAAMLLMLIIGGRITPAFSIAWLRTRGASTKGIRTVPVLEGMMLAGMVVVAASVVLELAQVTMVSALVSGVLVLVRVLLWRGWRVVREPLLWILHLSLLWIPLALWLLAGSAAGWWHATVWIHAAGVGAMGGLMLGVMSRVALGHTGRPLNLATAMVVAFVAVQGAALVRVAAGLGAVPWQTGLALSTMLWVAALGLFLACYTRILVTPRADGRPG